MQTQPAVKRRTPSKPRPRALPYPALPDEDPAKPGDRFDRAFWLAAWQRDVAQLAALTAFARQINYWAKPAALRDALGNSLTRAQIEAGASLKHLTQAGGLLFAWVPEGGAA